MLELFSNHLVPTTLSAAMTSSATTCTVTSTAGMPVAVAGISQFRAIVDSEYLIVTNVSGLTLTVARGQEGSAASAHASGAQFAHIITAGALGRVQVPGGGLSGYKLRKFSDVDGDFGWAPDYHAAQHQPDQSDDLNLHRGHMSESSLTTFDISDCITTNTLLTQTLYLCNVKSYTSFLATRMAGVESAAAASGLTLARFGIYSYEPKAVGAANMYTLLGATANDTTLFTSGTTQGAGSIYIRSLAASVPISRNTWYALAFLGVGTGMPSIRTTGTNGGFNDLTGMFTPVAMRTLGGTNDLPTNIAANTTFGTNWFVPFLGIAA